MKTTIFKDDKILHHLPKVVSWLNGNNPFAITVELDATNVCNHNCPGCCGGFGGSKDSLSFDEMKSIIFDVRMMGAKAITFTGGGEPLCNPNIIQAIVYAKDCGVDVGLITNGGLLHKRDIHAILNCCKWVRVSLDAGSEEVHRRVHGSSDYNKVIENIENLVTLKMKENFKCTIGLGYLTGKRTTYSDMSSFVELALSLGVDYAQFRPFLGYGKEDFHDFSPIQLSSLIGRSNNSTKIVSSEYKYNCINQGTLERQYSVCYGHQFATTICANGDVTVCCHTRGMKDMVIGNAKTESIHDIWNGIKRREVVKNINLASCPLLCRCDTFNTILWRIKECRQHVNFL